MKEAATDTLIQGFEVNRLRASMIKRQICGTLRSFHAEQLNRQVDAAVKSILRMDESTR